MAFILSKIEGEEQTLVWGSATYGIKFVGMGTLDPFRFRENKLEYSTTDYGTILLKYYCSGTTARSATGFCEQSAECRRTKKKNKKKTLQARKDEPQIEPRKQRWDMSTPLTVPSLFSPLWLDSSIKYKVLIELNIFVFI